MSVSRIVKKDGREQKEVFESFTTDLEKRNLLKRVNAITASMTEHTAKAVRKFLLDFPFEPKHDYIIIYPMPLTEKVTTSGLIVPTTAKETIMQGIVVRHGPGRFDMYGNFLPVETKIGEHVIYSQFAGAEYIFNGEAFRLMTDREVIGIVREAGYHDTEDKGAVSGGNSEAEREVEDTQRDSGITPQNSGDIRGVPVSRGESQGA